MFNQYTYKQKFTAILVVFLMLSVSAYKRSFSQLIQTYSQYSTLKEQLSDYNNKSSQLESLNRDVMLMNKVIGKAGESKETVQQEIIRFVSENHSEVSISDLQPIHSFQDENYVVITNQLDVTGTANQLLRLAYDFEKQFTMSRIVSIKYYTTKKNNKIDILHLKLIFQNYENIQ